MRKLVLAAAAVVACGSDAAGHSIMQRSDWHGRNFETYVPKMNTSVRWLELEKRTRWPKVDLPPGLDLGSIGPLVLPPTIPAATRVESTVPST